MKELGNRPTMVDQACRHSSSALLKGIMAEVVDTTQEKDMGLDSLRAAGEMMGTPGENRQTGAESGIEPFNISSVLFGVIVTSYVHSTSCPFWLE